MRERSPRHDRLQGPPPAPRQDLTQQIHKLATRNPRLLDRYGVLRLQRNVTPLRSHDSINVDAKDYKKESLGETDWLGGFVYSPPSPRSSASNTFLACLDVDKLHGDVHTRKRPLHLI